jgi:hypothetical protein
MSEYVTEMIAKDRLAELRKKSEDWSRARAAVQASSPLRVALGRALIRMGRRLQGAQDRSRTRRIGVGTVRTPRRSAPGAIRG